MSEVTIRKASERDALAIARLHAASWRTYYRAALPPTAPGEELEDERRRLWTRRLTATSEDQFVCLAEQDGEVLGFACAYGAEHEHWGSLLDDLHVRTDRQRRGVGGALVREVARWSHASYPEAGMYLWVLAQSLAARSFCERLGALDMGCDTWTPPGGTAVKRRRYCWPTLAALTITASRPAP